jgi:reductive dehalogenase
MKGIGLGAAGLGAAGAAAPVFHDLDEVMASPTNERKRDWWVKEIDHPTVEIDWSIMARHHSFHSTQSSSVVARYYGIDNYRQMSRPSNNERCRNNEPGYQLQDHALANGANTWAGPMSRFGFGSWRVLGSLEASNVAYRGYQTVITPEEIGVPKWSASPEENTRLLRAALVVYGASDIGVSELHGDHLKLVGLTSDNISTAYYPPNFPPPTLVYKPMEFIDADEGYCDEETGTYYLPDPHRVPLYEVTYQVPMPIELAQTAHSRLFNAANSSRYRREDQIQPCTLEFLRGIGYNGYSDSPYRAIPGLAGAVLSGLAENSRHTIMAMSPEFGAWGGYFHIITDLPLAPTKPIDAGMWKFCESCGQCANGCPSGAIEKKGGREPSWEPYPSAQTPVDPPLPGLGFDTNSPGETDYNKIGRKTYWTDMVICAGYRQTTDQCYKCYGNCVFNSPPNGAMIHDIVRATASTTGIFNSFFATMSENFGYGCVEGDAKEDWWNMSLPAYGFSTVVGAKHGGYDK